MYAGSVVYKCTAVQAGASRRERAAAVVCTRIVLYTGAAVNAERACVAAALLCKGVVACAFSVVYTGVVVYMCTAMHTCTFLMYADDVVHA